MEDVEKQRKTVHIRSSIIEEDKKRVRFSSSNEGDSDKVFEDLLLKGDAPINYRKASRRRQTILTGKKAYEIKTEKEIKNRNKSLYIEDIIKNECPSKLPDKTTYVVSDKNQQNEKKPHVFQVEAVSLGSMVSIVYQICNCIIKYTLIKIPFCFVYLSIMYGCFGTFIIGAMSIYSSYLLLKVHEATGEK